MNARKILSLALILTLGTTAAAVAGNEARVRAVHASPDAPLVDVLVNDTIPAWTGVPFEAVSDYETLPAATYNIKVVPTSGGPDTAVIDADVNLFYNRDYTVIALGLLDDIEPLVLEDKNIPSPPNKARIRFVHTVSDAPAVDIAVTGGPILFENIAFKEVGDYIKVPANTYDLEVRLAGTDTIVLDLPGVSVMGGTTYTVYATGALDPAIMAPLNAIISVDYESPSILRAQRPDRGTGLQAAGQGLDLGGRD